MCRLESKESQNIVQRGERESGAEQRQGETRCTTQRHNRAFQLGSRAARHEATVYIPAAKNSVLDHCDFSQASHVTRGCLVPGCRLNSSARVQRRECLQWPGGRISTGSWPSADAHPWCCLKRVSQSKLTLLPTLFQSSLLLTYDCVTLRSK